MAQQRGPSTEVLPALLARRDVAVLEDMHGWKLRHLVRGSRTQLSDPSSAADRRCCFCRGKMQIQILKAQDFSCEQVKPRLLLNATAITYPSFGKGKYCPSSASRTAAE